MSHSETQFGWAVSFMRAGYAGRGLVYLMLAGFSLYAIWHGGQAKGTGSVLKTLESSVWGQIVLALIALGMAAYAIWRLVDAAWDLEDYGSEREGTVARIGMIATGLLHAALGMAATAILLTAAGSSGGGSSTIAEWTGKVMSLPAGRILVAVGGAATFGAGLYYLHKAFRESYRDHLRANPVTRKWNVVLKAGVASQGVVVALIGGFLVYAAWTANPGEAGGAEKVFDFLASQPMGWVLVIAVCVGLLFFAVFCFVNAAYRIVPRVDGGGIESLADISKV